MLNKELGRVRHSRGQDAQDGGDGARGGARGHPPEGGRGQISALLAARVWPRYGVFGVSPAPRCTRSEAHQEARRAPGGARRTRRRAARPNRSSAAGARRTGRREARPNRSSAAGARRTRRREAAEGGMGAAKGRSRKRARAQAGDTDCTIGDTRSQARSATPGRRLLRSLGVCERSSAQISAQLSRLDRGGQPP